jgi:hypothetical protein
MTHPTCDLPDNVPDELVPDPQVAREFNVSLMTLWRWDRDPKLAELGWEPPVKIRKEITAGAGRSRNSRSRSGTSASPPLGGAPIDRRAAAA